ncbi:reverse transcriptase domain-containing protein [Tanacetum coccineum]
MAGQAPPQGPIPDLRSMEELLQAPTDGVGDAIVVPRILANQFELKTGLLNLVTAISFHGFENDDPHSHIRRFTKITQMVKLNQVPPDVIKLMLFPFSLEGVAQTWLEKEPPNSIMTWNDLVSKFVNHFFPPSKTTNLRNEIMRFQQRFAEGNFLTKNTQEALTTIENKSKVQTSRNKPQVASASGSSAQDAHISSLTNPQVPAQSHLQEALANVTAPNQRKILSQTLINRVGNYTERLYDTCGVHHVSTKDGVDIYMLVKREYPLLRGVLTHMLVAKLLVEQDNETSRELLRKIFMQVSTDLNYSSSCLENVKILKEQNEQLLKDLRTSKINAITYKTGLESIEERLLLYKKNDEEDIKLLKHNIYLKEVAITKLRRKLELAQKQKDEIQLTVEKFKNSSKNLSKLLDYQIVDKYKTGLGYNAVPPPYTGNFMPPKPDLSFSGLEEFINEPIVSEPIVEYK